MCLQKLQSIEFMFGFLEAGNFLHYPYKSRWKVYTPALLVDECIEESMDECADIPQYKQILRTLVYQ